MENTNEIAAALSKAQAKIMGAVKDANNPHFKSNFATLASVMDAIREPFAENGLAVIQPTVLIEGKLYIKTIIMHSSGQSVDGVYPVIIKDPTNPQSAGTGMSYGRRYSLAAMACIPQVDDDGNAASAPPPQAASAKHKPKAVERSVDKFIKSADISNYVVKVGKFKDRKLSDISAINIQQYLTELHSLARTKGQPLSGDWLEFAKIAESYITPPEVNKSEPIY